MYRLSDRFDIIERDGFKSVAFKPEDIDGLTVSVE